MSRCSILLVTLLLAPELMAQDDNNGEPASRVEEIQDQRMQKAAVVPPHRSALSKLSSKIDNVLEKSPVMLGVGGLGPGAGFTVGYLPEWSTDDDHLRFRLRGILSVNRFYTAGAGMELPHVSKNDLGFGFDGLHRDLPQLTYYGSGPDSLKSNRTDYRLEETLFESYWRFTPNRHLTSICKYGKLFLNVGPGTNNRLASTQEVFSPIEAPGINEQSDYLLGGCFVELDHRDFPGDPNKGTFVAGGYDRYHATEIGAFSFNRVSGEVEHYIPFFNDRRVIALHAKTVLSFHGRDQVVPFYMQTTLGGDRDMRGFRRFRFYGENSIVFNAEYRWEISAGWDMAAFGDAGKVFNRPGDISLSNLERSLGFGLRLKGDHGVALRIDTGFSREGVQVWLMFGKLFQ